MTDAVGTNTSHIPWINILFNLSIYKHAWNRAWHDRTIGLPERVLYLVSIALFAPLMLVGLPFTLWAMRKKRRAPVH